MDEIPTPRNFTEWMLAFTLLVIIADKIIGFWKSHLREQPRPADTYATKGELAAQDKTCQERNQVNTDRLDRHGQYMATQDELEAVSRELGEWKQEIKRNGDERKRDIEAKVETSFKLCQERIDRVEGDLKKGFDGLHNRLTNFSTDFSGKVGELVGELRAERERRERKENHG
jgi:hypothetical protein